MNNIYKETESMLADEGDKMNKYLNWYLELEGDFNGKIRIDIKYAKSIKEDIISSKNPYPVKLAHMLNINPTEYNSKYPGYVQYENRKLKAYGRLYLKKKEVMGFYDEDMGFSIGQELLFKEFADENPQFKKIIKIRG